MTQFLIVHYVHAKYLDVESPHFDFLNAHRLESPTAAASFRPHPQSYNRK